MGQRLNIEISDGYTTFANAYYHWSGFTKSAYKLTKIIIEIIKSEKYDKKDKLLYSIRLLEETGAGLTNNIYTTKEINQAKNYQSSYGFLCTLEQQQNNEMKFANHIFENESFRECDGRNQGLISISEYGKNETRSWEEARVTINIEKNTIDFRVFYVISEEEKDDEYYKDREAVESELDLENLDFIDFEKLNEFIDNSLECLIKLKNGKSIMWIY